MPRRADDISRAPLIAGTLLGCTVAVLSTAAAAQPPQHPVYGPGDPYFDVPGYQILRPGPGYAGQPPQWTRHPGFPDGGIYGPQSRYYGGPDYDALRPRPFDPRSRQPGYQAQPSPQSGIYGPGSRRYGGADYDMLRPPRMSYDRGYEGAASAFAMPGGNAGRMMPRRGSIFGPNSERYGGPDYGQLQRTDIPRGPGPQGEVPVAPGESIYSEQSPQYGGPDYSGIRPDTEMSAMETEAPRADDLAEPAPETSIYGRDSKAYGGPDYRSLQRGQQR